MFALKCLFLCISCFVVASSSPPLAPFIKPCSPEDSKCMCDSAAIALPYFAKGMEEFGMPPLDPIKIKEVNADNGKLKLSFANMILTGPGKSKFINIVRDTTKQTIKVVLDIPIDVRGDYTMGGQFASLDVYGEGGFNIITDRLRLTVDIRLTYFNDKNGKKHLKISGFDYHYDLPEEVHLKFENLCKDDKAQADLVEQFIKENNKDVAYQFGDPLLKKAITMFVQIIDKFFTAVPSEELELP